jgi:hypothetical protein
MCTPMNGHSLPLELHIPLFLDLAVIVRSRWFTRKYVVCKYFISDPAGARMLPIIEYLVPAFRVATQSPL